MAMDISLVAEHQEEYALSGLRLTMLQQSQDVIKQMHLADGLDNDGGKLRFGLLVQIRSQGASRMTGSFLPGASWRMCLASSVASVPEISLSIRIRS